MLTLLLVIVIGAVTACGSNNKSGSETGTNTATASNTSNASEAPAEKVKLSFWHTWTGDDNLTKAYLKLIDQFQEDHPNITLDIQAMPQDAYKTRLKTAAAANEMPDVFLAWAGAMTKELVAGKAVRPLNDLLDSKPEWKNSFLANSFNDFTVDNQIYGIPTELTPTSLVYYNKSFFDQYGVKVPQTWDELKQAVEIFKKNNVIPIALGDKGSWLAQSCILSALADRVTGTEWFLNAAAQNGAKFTDPEFVKSLTYLQELAKIGAFQDGFISIDNVGQEQLYNQGKAAMFIEGAWAVTNLVTQSPKDILDATHVTILPAIPGGKGKANSTSGVVGAGPAISSNMDEAKKAAAYELVYALSGPEAQKMSVENNKLVSYKVDVPADKVSPLFAEVNQLVGTLEFSPVYDAALTSAGTDAVNNGLQELLLGGDPQKIAEKIQAAVAKSLGK
ncbi:extracellular solute-binding protein [Cohnella sp. NL03-T5]|nr:extracellular solute-binding protein [Cohnella silvisoli]